MDEIVLVAGDGIDDRLDRYVASRVTSLSRSRIQQLVGQGLITVNRAPAKASRLLRPGDVIRVRVPSTEETTPVPQRIPLKVVYEDQDLVVVDKPAGMVVHPAHGHKNGTLVNALLARYPDLPFDKDNRPGIVHRLDKDTSGLILVAKNETARQHLQRQFKRGEVDKVYLALVEGRVEPRRGVIDAPIGRDARHRKRMAVVPDGGRPSLTEYKVSEYLGEHTLLEVSPKTGRTHQVRLHLAFIGHPVSGDTVYGYRKPRLGLKRQFLHAHRLAFRLPSSGQRVSLVSELPEDLQQVLDGLRRPSHMSPEEWEQGGR
jgi:23S rRNA pseudouridine1911/1915/1917 synthase